MTRAGLARQSKVSRRIKKEQRMSGESGIDRKERKYCTTYTNSSSMVCIVQPTVPLGLAPEVHIPTSVEEQEVSHTTPTRSLDWQSLAPYVEGGPKTLNCHFRRPKKTFTGRDGKKGKKVDQNATKI